MTTNKTTIKRPVRREDRRLKIYDLTGKVVKWLSVLLQIKERLVLKSGDTANLPQKLLDDLCKRLSTRIKTRGVKDTISFVKATRNNFYNYLSGNPLRVEGSKCFGSPSFPSILGPLKKYVDDENLNVIRLILTVLTASRALKLKGEVDMSSVTQPIKGDVPDLTQNMPSF